MNYVASSTRRKSISFVVLTVESASFSLEMQTHLSFLNELGGPAKCPFKATSVCSTPSQEAGSTPPRSFSSKHILQPKGSPTTQNDEMSQAVCDTIYNAQERELFILLLVTSLLEEGTQPCLSYLWWSLHVIFLALLS